jgi:hypothetical protein
MHAHDTNRKNISQVSDNLKKVKFNKPDRLLLLQKTRSYKNARPTLPDYRYVFWHADRMMFFYFENNIVLWYYFERVYLLLKHSRYYNRLFCVTTSYHYQIALLDFF